MRADPTPSLQEVTETACVAMPSYQIQPLLRSKAQKMSFSMVFGIPCPPWEHLTPHRHIRGTALTTSSTLGSLNYNQIVVCIALYAFNIQLFSSW